MSGRAEPLRRSLRELQEVVNFQWDHFVEWSAFSVALASVPSALLKRSAFYLPPIGEGVGIHPLSDSQAGAGAQEIFKGSH